MPEASSPARFEAGLKMLLLALSPDQGKYDPQTSVTAGDSWRKRKDEEFLNTIKRERGHLAIGVGLPEGRQPKITRGILLMMSGLFPKPVWQKMVEDEFPEYHKAVEQAKKRA